MKIDIQKLREQTSAAISQGKKIADEEKIRKAREEAARIEKNRIEAESIVANIPSLCERAAAAGFSSVEVFNGRKRSDEWGSYESVWEKGGHVAKFKRHTVGAMILDACDGAGLKASAFVQDDGCGMDSWPVIIVSWAE